MKNLIALFCILLLSTSVMAEETQKSTSSEQWVCTGYGVLRTGGPGGVITFAVQGSGDTQLEALNDAYQNCHSRGLQSCMINSCMKR